MNKLLGKADRSIKWMPVSYLHRTVVYRLFHSISDQNLCGALVLITYHGMWVKSTIKVNISAKINKVNRFKLISRLCLPWLYNLRWEPVKSASMCIKKGMLYITFCYCCGYFVETKRRLLLYICTSKLFLRRLLW